MGKIKNELYQTFQEKCLLKTEFAAKTAIFDELFSRIATEDDDGEWIYHPKLLYSALEGSFKFEDKQLGFEVCFVDLGIVYKYSDGYRYGLSQNYLTPNPRQQAYLELLQTIYADFPEISYMSYCNEKTEKTFVVLASEALTRKIIVELIE